jgi:hypothetical protein
MSFAPALDVSSFLAGIVEPQSATNLTSSSSNPTSPVASSISFLSSSEVKLVKQEERKGKGGRPRSTR